MSPAPLVFAALTLLNAEPAEDLRWVVASVANVRATPSADGKIAGKLGIGARVLVRDCARQFCRVRPARGTGPSGYVAESLLARSAPSHPKLLAEAVRSLERACAMTPDDDACLAALEHAYRANEDEDAAARVAIVRKRKQERTAPKSGAGARVHDTGMHHGDEAHVKDGEAWFALCEGKFRRVTVRVATVRDELLDEEGEMTGREVTAPCEASVLLTGVPGFSPDRVRVARAHDDGSFSLGAQHLALRGEPGQAVVVDMKIGQKVPIGGLDLNEGGQPTVLFAGDLDGDGKLDFIASYSEHYNVSALHLLLSSASDGWAPREVYEHRDTGC